MASVLPYAQASFLLRGYGDVQLLRRSRSCEVLDPDLVGARFELEAAAARLAVHEGLVVLRSLHLEIRFGISAALESESREAERIAAVAGREGVAADEGGVLQRIG